jgi:hypothetical protein
VGVMLLPLALALIILWRRRSRPPRAQGT